MFLEAGHQNSLLLSRTFCQRYLQFRLFLIFQIQVDTWWDFYPRRLVSRIYLTIIYYEQQFNLIGKYVPLYKINQLSWKENLGPLVWRFLRDLRLKKVLYEETLYVCVLMRMIVMIIIATKCPPELLFGMG